MDIVAFGKFGAFNSTLVTTDLDGCVREAGTPSMTTWIEHATEDGKYLTGFWEAMPGTYRVDFYENHDEFVHLFEGRLTLTEDGGKTTRFVGGDAFYVPQGLERNLDDRGTGSQGVRDPGAGLSEALLRR